MEEHLNASKIARIKGLGADPDHAEIESILNERPRIDKIAIKDAKLRTFITEDSSRDDLVAHVYDITYGTVERGVDNLVVIDDSIVRGTTLKKSILRILDRLAPNASWWRQAHLKFATPIATASTWRGWETSSRSRQPCRC